jgi:uncharacterized protein
MSVTHIVRCSDVEPMPWKNGGGLTRELLAWPTTDDWIVRVSVADIARDGPFSAFPGVTRHFAVLAGVGVSLEGVGELRPGDPPVTFDGEIERECGLLDGYTRDLNLMIKSEFGEGVLRRLESARDVLIPNGAIIQGVFDSGADSLTWAEGSDVLNVDHSAKQSSSVFQFAFWTHEALRRAVANP